MTDHSDRLGGSDTTATAIRSVMLYVMTSPQVYITLQSEIDNAIRNGKISSPIVRDIEARALPYLQAVILEGLRMHPPAAGLLSKVVPPEGDTIGGVFVPGGTEIAVNTWSVMRNPDTFGQAPEIFRPERWLGISEEKYAEMSRVVDLIFGHGKYKCLGKTVAWLELNKVFVEVSKRVVFKDHGVAGADECSQAYSKFRLDSGKSCKSMEELLCWHHST